MLACAPFEHCHAQINIYPAEFMSRIFSCSVIIYEWQQNDVRMNLSYKLVQKELHVIQLCLWASSFYRQQSNRVQNAVHMIGFCTTHSASVHVACSHVDAPLQYTLYIYIYIYKACPKYKVLVFLKIQKSFNKKKKIIFIDMLGIKVLFFNIIVNYLNAHFKVH